MPTAVPWHRSPTERELQPERGAAEALELAWAAVAEHVDVHCSVFTPARFLRLLGEAHALGLCPFELAGCRDTEPGEIEFFVRLRNRADIDHELASRAFFDGAAGHAGRASRSRRLRGRVWGRRLFRLPRLVAS